MPSDFRETTFSSEENKVLNIWVTDATEEEIEEDMESWSKVVYNIPDAPDDSEGNLWISCLGVSADDVFFTWKEFYRLLRPRPH